jgi:hypothetical protein
MGNQDDKAEMLKALAAYRGPIQQCQADKAGGAGDLAAWALRRADGRSGVPDGETARKIKKANRRLARKTRLYQRFMASAAAQHMTFQKWLGKPPAMRRKLLAERIEQWQGRPV